MVVSGQASNRRVHRNQFGSLSECWSSMLRNHLFLCISVIFRGNTIFIVFYFVLCRPIFKTIEKSCKTTALGT